MYLEPYVKIKPKYLKLLPGISDFTANTIYPYIFLPRIVYDNLKTDQPNPYYIALLIHEKAHYGRLQKIGTILSYIFSPNFRLKEELLAVQEAIEYLKIQGFHFIFNEKEKTSPDLLYLWPISRSYTEEQLRHLWDRVKV